MGEGGSLRGGLGREACDNGGEVVHLGRERRDGRGLNASLDEKGSELREEVHAGSALKGVEMDGVAVTRRTRSEKRGQR